MSKKLKPCPFCGGEAKLVLEFQYLGIMHVKELFYARCSECGTRVSGSTFWDSEEEAIAAWNRRAGDE